MNIGKISFFLCFFILCRTTLSAQRHQVFSPDIRSLQVVANGDWQSMPVLELGNGFLSVDFDDLTHEYHRYTYKVEHCEANWKPSSQLFESDYIEGFANDNIIDDIKESTLTNTIYTHYRVTIPNKSCRPLISGNYVLKVFDDYHREVLRAYFMIVEPAERCMKVGLTVTTNTDLTINQKHQQVEMELKYGNYKVTNPNMQIQTVILQNKRWETARWNSKPQYVMSDGLKWNHNQDFIFEAGNEYRKFEILSTDVSTMGIERISWDGESFHAYPFISTPRQNYVYDEDANGAFLIRNSDNIAVQTESDYMIVHFTLDCRERVNGNIYVNGDWTHGAFTDDYKLVYNDSTRMYELSFPLKLGYYSYQYLLMNVNGEISVLPSEGCFYQTENSYQVLIYYREEGGRTDKLVSYRTVQFKGREANRSIY